MHIRYSFVKQNYSNILRLDGKTISNGEIENICRYIFYMRMTNEISQREIEKREYSNTGILPVFIHAYILTLTNIVSRLNDQF